MNEPVRIGDATLYLGDCMEILPTLPTRVDAVITDPPYSANTHKMAKTNRGAGHGVSLVTFSALDGEQFDSVMGVCVAASRGWVVATCDYKHAARYYEAPEFVRLGAWVKLNPMPQISADRPGQGFETVLILHSGDTPKAWNRGGGSGVWTFPVHGDALVPTQKPLALVSAFVGDFTQPGQTIADPFMGSGTTGVAAVAQGRSFVGIEANADHFAIACRRIEQAYAQRPLFEAPQPKQEQIGLIA
jgi:site-specific DNA-methyltransferase (adenine-specific)